MLSGDNLSWRRHLTLTNVLVILAILVGWGGWMRGQEFADVSVGAKLSAVESRTTAAEARIEQADKNYISRELLGAKLDTISEHLVSIEKRLDALERKTGQR